MKSKTLIAIAVMISTAATIALAGTPAAVPQIDGPELPCDAPPPGASQAMIDCYSAACSKWQKGVASCNGEPLCIGLKTAIYHNDIALCNLSVTMETSDDLVVYQTGDGWAVAWPGDEFPSAAMTRLAFNI